MTSWRFGLGDIAETQPCARFSEVDHIARGGPPHLWVSIPGLSGLLDALVVGRLGGQYAKTPCSCCERRSSSRTTQQALMVENGLTSFLTSFTSYCVCITELYLNEIRLLMNSVRSVPISSAVLPRDVCACRLDHYWCVVRQVECLGE